MAEKIVDFKTVTFGTTPQSKRSDNPIIGISVNIDDHTSRLHEAYIRSVINTGGVPILIPATDDMDALREIVERIDGLLLSGGSDIEARYFGESDLEGLTDVIPERDTYDFLLLKVASDRQLPIFGICRGMQVMNVAFGGSLWQDIPSQYHTNTIRHSVLTDKEKPAHGVEIEKPSIISEIIGCGETGVNSRHHQALKEIAPGFRVTATASDGITEAIEAFPLYRMLGVQWHPENMATEGDNKQMQQFFSRLVYEASLFCKAKKIHQKHLSVDSHCDTPMLFEEHTVDIGKRDPVACVDLVKMYEGKLDSVFVVAYIPQKYPAEKATDYAYELLTQMQKQIEHNKAYVGQARTFNEAENLKREGRKAIFLGIENGHALQGDLNKLDFFKRMGVTYITLCHNGANAICDSAVGEPLYSGLSEFGKEVVRRMNQLGIVVDLSHAAESSFYDVLELSTVPVIASHSSARAICDHPRNLTDDQIRALSAKGGVVQVCLYDGFLMKGRNATLMDAVDHIEHIIRVGGIECVGIGSDFDGGGGIEGCRSANELINITVELIRRGYDEKQIAAIWGGNIRRAINQIQQQQS